MLENRLHIPGGEIVYGEGIIRGLPVNLHVTILPGTKYKTRWPDANGKDSLIANGEHHTFTNKGAFP